MYSKGISWIDDCRIPFVDEVRTVPVHSTDVKDDKTLFGLHPTIQRKRVETTQGRFPANLLVSDDMLNDGIITKQTKWNKIHDDSIGGIFGGGRMNPNNSYGDKGSNSRYYDLDKWFNNLIDG
jgi:hypothetical protein